MARENGVISCDYDALNNMAFKLREMAQEKIINKIEELTKCINNIQPNWNGNAYCDFFDNYKKLFKGGVFEQIVKTLYVDIPRWASITAWNLGEADHYSLNQIPMIEPYGHIKEPITTAERGHKTYWNGPNVEKDQGYVKGAIEDINQGMIACKLHINNMKEVWQSTISDESIDKLEKYIENTKVQMEEIENMLQNAINSGGNRITEADQGAKLS